MERYKIELKWAFTFAVMTLLWTLVEELGGLHDKHIDRQPVFGAFILVPAVVIYVMALKAKRKEYGGTFTYKQVFFSGLLLSLFIGLFSIATSVINLKIISPHYLSNAAKHAVATGNVKIEEANQQYAMWGFIISSAIAAVINGIIITAIVMLFLKDRKQRSLAI
ncbi:DUF4199 domain-containing protein [Pedobacter heparinus]|uniref:DUF4199 domain-containing protein n=1 Tax=Pedobacter heparinus (strain ATCC 13125 / DSM 2366 / CIP 104194 / JCM 7457 / NBRC 12017 / NCIMB 9290 / NRRL B-14731 / HIM 762-3) TaxID=485917 RepID=C6XVC0_PEDHD|nr:DUF4199 domain-containing protein [Pedobacter heparinus]ACU03986.1 conserved hypothetical protein [Pedobacter heparinus DSM 2366]